MNSWVWSSATCFCVHAGKSGTAGTRTIKYWARTEEGQGKWQCKCAHSFVWWCLGRAMKVFLAALGVLHPSGPGLVFILWVFACTLPILECKGDLGTEFFSLSGPAFLRH